MKMRLLLTLAGLVITSMLPRVLVFALLTSISNATPLQPSETRQDWQDLEVIALDSQGDLAKTVYYSYDQLLTLPTVTVKTERDPNTNTLNPTSSMPPHPTFDDNTFNALEAYFKAMMSIE